MGAADRPELVPRFARLTPNAIRSFPPALIAHLREAIAADSFSTI
jgi:hypothetical protein